MLTLLSLKSCFCLNFSLAQSSCESRKANPQKLRVLKDGSRRMTSALNVTDKFCPSKVSIESKLKQIALFVLNCCTTQWFFALLRSPKIHSRHIIKYSFFVFVYFSFYALPQMFIASFLATLIFLACAGNILVCVAIYTERSLRRIGNLFLASLAIADLFVSLLVMTFASVNDILGEFCGRGTQFSKWSRSKNPNSLSKSDWRLFDLHLMSLMDLSAPEFNFVALNARICALANSILDTWLVSIVSHSFFLRPLAARYSTGYWIFGAEFCDTWIAFDVMCSTSSILNLCAISLDRYIHIRDPLR